MKVYTWVSSSDFKATRESHRGDFDGDAEGSVISEGEQARYDDFEAVPNLDNANVWHDEMVLTSTLLTISLYFAAPFLSRVFILLLLFLFYC